MAQDPDVMMYLKEDHIELPQKIELLAKQHQLRLERNQEFDYERGGRGY